MAGSKRIRILHMLYNPERQNVFFGELQLQDTENGGVSDACALPQHAGARSAQASPTKNSRRRFFVGITGCLCFVTNIRSEKNAIERFFHSCVLRHGRYEGGRQTEGTGELVSRIMARSMKGN